MESLHSQKTLLAAPVLLARRVFDELSRVLNHLLTLSATALDLSAMGPIFWAFEERENILELCEQASGARMHTAMYRPFFFDFSVFTGSFLNELAQFLTRCSRSLSGAFLGLLNNRSLKSRLAGVGQVSRAKIQSYGLTGILARSAGIFIDQRFFNSQTSSYAAVTVRTFLGKRGDNLDRFLIRIKETAECFRVLSQSLQTFRFGSNNKYVRELGGAEAGLQVTLCKPRASTAPGNFFSSFGTYLPLYSSVFFFYKAPEQLYSLPRHYSSKPSRLVQTVRPTLPNVIQAAVQPSRGKFSSMESLITHFRLTSEGWPTNPGFSYQSVESPKGEVGVTLISSGTSKPSRLKLRTPVSHNMHLIPTISIGSIFADFVATFCSLDIVLGEIDR